MSGRKDVRGGMGIYASAGALSVVILASALLLLLIFARGAAAFWPRPLEEWRLPGEEYLLVEVRDTMEDGSIRARSGNRELYRLDFVAVPPADIVERSAPEDAIRIERIENGPFHGYLRSVEFPGASYAGREKIGRFLSEVDRIRTKIASLQDAVGQATRRINEGEGSQAEFERLSGDVAQLREELAQYKLRVALPGGQQSHELDGANLLRVSYPNQLGFFGRLGGWLGNVWRFIVEDPREANTDGGVWPALVGTSLLVILMSILVVPFGVLAAVYLNEYAKESWFVKLVRIAVNNLAGVPSIVYGVFGLGFLIYGLGGSIDRLFFADALARGEPTLGAGCILWASVTMSLLTVPVVIVATEEGLRACPRDWRESALALGATKWETLRKVILPAARPGILTGMILAVSRAAGEVAPLMVTGVVSFARDLPMDAVFPFLHPDRRFMHLGFHIYSVGFQSPNVEATVPLVYATAALLLALVLTLNLLAIRLRSRARRAIEGR